MLRIILVALLIPLGLFPQDLIKIQSSDGIMEMGSRLRYFRDSTASMSFDAVRSMREEGKFLQSPSNILNFNLTSDRIWLYGKFTADSGGPWYLESNNPSIQELIYYIRVNGGAWQMDTQGLSVPMHKRPLQLYRLIQPIHIRGGDTAEVYIQAYDFAPLLIQMRAGTLDQFFEDDHHDNRLHGIYFGLVIMMILYNAFLFVTNRNVVYLFYVGYMLFNALFVAIINGYIILLPEWVNVALVNKTTIVPSLFGVFGVLFTNSFLYTKKHAPVWRKILILLLTLPLGATLLTFLGYSRSGFFMLQLGGLLFAISTLVVGILVYARGYRPAKYYVFGFGSYFIGLFMLIIVDIVHLPYHDQAMAALEIGGAIEAIMLSFAIGDKLNTSQREKQIAQAEALKAATENERIIREQNILLEQKVKERTREIGMQKDIIEEKNKDILSSIHYAKRIQNALLASDQRMQENLGSHFILYKPKDIVSGDFYWSEQTGDGKTLLCVGDCTGHGVPGAFMSLLNITFLNEALKEFPDGDPSKILDYVRGQVIRSLATDEEGGKDGMDAVLIRLDPVRKLMHAALANNPIWILRGSDILEILPDKMPVGKHHLDHRSFKTREFQLRGGDRVFLFTDGFADQFGGENLGKVGGKKFKYKNLKDLLIRNKDLDNRALKTVLEQTFEGWKGTLEQVDDVLVTGIEIPTN